MAEPITIAQLIDASEDAQSLSSFVNADAATQVPRRLAGPIETLEYWRNYMSALAKGKDGVSATIDLTATTGVAGTQVSVVTGGTPTARTFALTIPRGDKGDSAYTVAVNNGFVGTEADWNLYLKSDGSIQALQQFMTADSETVVSVPDYGNIKSLQGNIKTMFTNGGLPAKPFATKAKMTTEGASLADGQLAQVYNETANNGLYVKTAGDWVKSGYDPLTQAQTYINATATAKIAESESLFLKKSVNLYNRDTVTLNKVISSSGVITDNTTYVISDFIAVIASSAYNIYAASTSHFVTASYYTSGKIFIRRDDIIFSSGSTSKVVTIPSDATYVRFSINKTRYLANDNAMFSLGSEIPTYTPYSKPELHDVVISDDIVSDISSKITITSVADGHIVPSKNLFDVSTLLKDFVIASNSLIVANVAYYISDYFPVESNSQYTSSTNSVAALYPWNNIAYYDVNKNFITRIDPPSTAATSPWTVTTPATAKYVRFNINSPNPYVNGRMFNAGATALPFTAHTDVLTNIALADDVMQQISSDLNINVVDNVIFDTTTTGVFSTAKVWSYPEFTGIQSADVYAMYEALRLQYPDYITKQALTSDSFGNPISCYKFNPKRPTASVTTRFPKIFLTLGTHGHEHVSPLATYLMLKEMCENWSSSELLETLRFNVDILVIPVVNPSGWNAFTRKTGNGVDINRNFPDGWYQGESDTPTYGGTAPLSEIEAQNIAQVIAENKDIDICYDFHNFHGQDANQGYIWLASGGAYEQHMCQVLVSKLTRKWRKDFAWFPAAPWFAGYTDGTKGGMIQDYARAQGIKFAGTFEVCRTVWAMPNPVMYDSTHCKMHVESITNWLLINLNEISRV